MQPVTQSTEYTTAAAGLLAILNEINGLELSLENELEIWRESVLLPTRASSVFGLALYAKKRGLDVTILVESCNYDYPEYRFKRYTKSDILIAQKNHELFVKKVHEEKIPFEVTPLQFSQIKEFAKKHFLLLRVNEGLFRNIASTSKYIVVYAYNKGIFKVLDPFQENPLLTVSEEKLRESFETLASKKKRDHCVLVF